MRFLFVVNTPEFFLSHRLPLANAARRAGFVVHVATGPGLRCNTIEEMGFTHHFIPLSRSGQNPLMELRALWAILTIVRSFNPHLVHLVTIKPVLYGGLVCRLARVPAVVAAVSGLGSVFVSEGRRARYLRWGVEFFYRVALRHRNIRVIVQNREDEQHLVNLGAVRREQTVQIRGSGIALSDYVMYPEPDGIPVVTFVARLLREKGILDFVEAARILKQRGIDVRFWLVGGRDLGNPSSVSDEDVAGWVNAGLVEAKGYREDVAFIFKESNLVVLPSYREGLPKVLAEAAACGRAVITTNVPGCRDAIEPGKTGLLVPAREPGALADAIEALLENSALRLQMGAAGRALAERNFSIEIIVDAHLKVYSDLLGLEVSYAS
jgi:glycosyltransferase involved in cell wall biosynthesis